ncbi:insulin gene enhancer protein ISL-2B isoform X1 [Oncorhynchus mykiss]|uniref:insulin gene enhancer protein ISL-2B isoform X1 n=1 Tax=Oncorhynchus mykiss TaxID=8022 RepID=UPI001877E2B2|nr:insulin gene enhancer protein ISL-2B isoform X1 [Oncorhynchus mykiss]
MLCDGPMSGESLLSPAQTEFHSVGTVDVLSEYTLMLPGETLEDHSNTSKLGPECNEESCPQGAVWPCAGCGESIRDPVVLRVGSNQQWHTGCLCCDECHCPLGESVSCFLRDGRTLCRTDYARLFAEKCGGCGEAVLSSDLVVRAGRQNYHPDCLHCSLCGALLMPGVSFTLGPGGPCCQAEHTMPEQQIQKADSLKKRKGSGRRGGVWERRWLDRGRSRGVRVRVRTVLSDTQLKALCTCYSQTPRPDAEVKLQLSQLTGLNKRVIRVWFQNKRCKDKKSHAKKGGRPVSDLDFTALLCTAARPMVVLSPEPPDFALQIYVYESSWQPLDGQIKLSADHDELTLTHISQRTCFSEDLGSPPQQGDEYAATIRTI